LERSYCYKELKVVGVAGALGKALWAEFHLSMDVHRYVCIFWDERLIKSPTRELALKMRGELLRRILNPSHGPGFDRHPPYENARSGFEPYAAVEERSDEQHSDEHNKSTVVTLFGPCLH
jgi:hypothetical protein